MVVQRKSTKHKGFFTNKSMPKPIQDISTNRQIKITVCFRNYIIQPLEEILKPFLLVTTPWAYGRKPGCISAWDDFAEGSVNFSWENNVTNSWVSANL